MEDDVRIPLAALAAGAIFAAGCHADSTAPSGRQAATDAAQTLLHLADSLSAHGGTTSEVGAYRGLAALLMGTGRLSTVTISVDGISAPYLATAQEIDVNGCPAGAVCTAMLRAPIRSVIAWDKSNPRRAVQLFTTDFSGESWAPNPSVGGSMMLYDGTGALYGGSSTTHSVGVTHGDTPCDRPSQNVPAIHAPVPCTQAEFQVAFDATLNLVPLEGLASDSLAGAAASAPPSHRVAMTSQLVHGTHVQLTGLCIDSCSIPNPPGTTPPISPPWRDSLAASLAVSVGSDVTFSFTVKNTRSTSTDVHFNDGQQFDIRVWNDNNVLVWRWGAYKAFPQMVGTRTLAAGESVTWVEHWTLPARGSYRAAAYLTSSSHGAMASTTLTVP